MTVPTEVRRALDAVDRAIQAGRLGEAREGLLALGNEDALASAHALRASRIAASEGEAAQRAEWAARGADAWSEASPDPLLAHVHALLGARNEAAAMSALARLAERHPDHPAVLFGRAKLAQSDRGRIEALELIEAALATAPRMWPLHQARLELLLTERLADADAALTRIAELWPKNANRHAMAAAEVHFARGKLAEAIDAAGTVHPPTVASLRLQASALARSGRLADALRVLDELTIQAPAQGHAARVRLLIEAGRLENALAALRRQIAAAPDPSGLRAQEARLLGRLGRFREAEELLREELAKRPNDALRIALADRLEADGRPHEALDLLTDLATTKEVCAKRWPLLAQLGRNDALEAEAERTRARDIPPARAIVRTTRILSRTGSDRLAIALLDRSLENEAAAGADPALLDHLLAQSSRFMPIEEIGKRIATMDAHLPKAIGYRLLAKAFDRAGEAEEALRTWRRIATAERTEADVTAIARLLNDRHARAVALRYLSVHARTWPGLERMVITLHAQHGNMAAGRARLNASGLDDATRRRAELQLSVQEGRAVGDAALLNEVDGGSLPFMLQPILRQALTHGDVRTVEAARERFPGGQDGQRAHWGSSLPGQLLADLKATEATLGEAGLAALRSGPLRDLARSVVAHPRLYALAAMLIARIGPSGDFADVTRADRANTRPTIPLLVHQYWNDDPPPAAVAALVESWAGVPDVEHMLWNRRSALRWLREIGSAWEQAFRMANNPAEEADFLRLCILWRVGGVWADADDRLLGSIDRLTEGGGLIAWQEPLGFAIGNNVLVSRAEHLVLAYATETARRDLLARSNESTWQKTGPGLLTRAVAQYAARSIVAGDPSQARGALRDVTIHPQPALRREVGIHTRLPHKAGEGYWNARRSADPGYGALLDRAIAMCPDRTTDRA